ncbi:putative ABC transporter [Xylaria digitata]|nr:putative ABC transporter [Xylaria digitata]
MAPDSALVLDVASTACATIFIVTIPSRLWKLHRSRLRSTPSYRGTFKFALGALLTVILSVFWTRCLGTDFPHKIYFLVPLFTSILASFGLSVILFQEQYKYYRASDQVKLYFLCSIVCDGIYLTIPSGTGARLDTLRPVMFRCLAHLLLFVFECWPRDSPFSILNEHTSPEKLYGLLDRVFFTWINPILIRGYKNALINEDLPLLNQHMSSELTRIAIIEAWSQGAKPPTKTALPLSLLKCLKRPFLAAIIPRVFLIIFQYSQPTLIKQSIRYVTAYSSYANDDYGFWLVLSAVAIYIGLALSTAIYQNSLNTLKLMTRSALIGLIHEKIIESPSISYDDGEASTLMSTDADSLDGIAEMFHETWAQVIEVMIGITLLAREVGWIWPLPLFLIYLCSHMSRFVAKNLQPRQKAWNNATQNRLAVVSSVLSSIKIVKMVGLQLNLTHRIQQLREAELWEASKLRWIRVYYNMSANALGIFSPAITLVIFAVISSSQGRELDTETVFTTVAILSMITHPANMIMTIVPRAVSAFAGFERIQSFLVRPSLETYRTTKSESVINRLPQNVPSHQVTSNPAIRIEQLRIGQEHVVLEGVNIEVAAGSFAIVSGPTGSGKTTLLRAIIGEISPTHGSISLATEPIAYCAQRPWLPSGTVRDVICGAPNTAVDLTENDERWYHEVTEICCLTHDFESFPAADQTQVGSRGLNLSGGQRQRVTLARALFARCDILLLDDILSGLDGDTEKAVFNNLFGPTGLIRRLKTTVILVSNSSQYFEAADNIVVLDQHGVLEQGSWENIKVKAGSISKFSRTHNSKDNPVLSAFDKLSKLAQVGIETEADLARRTGDPALYSYYFRSVELSSLIFLIITPTIYAFFITFPQYWLQLWTEIGGKETWFYTTGYILISIISWTSTCAQMWCLLIRLAPQSGWRLHQLLLDIVASAPLSYFSQTENGSILNRFSQDIQFIDNQLPSALQTVVVQILKLVMQVILLCVAQKWLAVSLPACMFVLYIVQKVYLRTSRQLRFLELQSRAGVFSSFLDTIEGLETIRAFGWSEAVRRDNIRCVNDAQRPEFLLLCLQRWLNIVLDLLAAAIAASVLAIAVALRGHVSGGQIGVALNIMLVVNGTLLKLVVSWTDLENSLGAISRIKLLEMTTPSEGGSLSSLAPPENWPPRGHIKISNISASYQASSVVLKNVSLDIPAGRKLIVCGRTGSTLLSVLLRLLEPRSGTIELDGIDIKQVSLDVLRRKCFVAVTQDPLLMPNETLRFNLDPDSSTSDDLIISAISKAGLESHFLSGNIRLGGEAASFAVHPILDRKLSLFQELSVGQCQLFALCRALVKTISLRDSGVMPVVLLDEITSSLDTTTESRVHRIIDDEFTKRGHTVIIVAHRLGALEEHTKPGRDGVVLMADGRVQDVIQDLGPSTFQNLAKLA